MKNKLKMYLMMFAVSGLVITGCDSVQQPVMEETAVETEVIEESTTKETVEEEVVEESIETEENTKEEVVETEEVEEENVTEETPVEETPVEEAPVEETPVEIPVEEAPVEEILVETPIEEAPLEETPTQTDIAADVSYPCPVKISDFTFMGLPINGSNYEQWKAALGYTGDDSLDNPNKFIYEENIGIYIGCRKDKEIYVGYKMNSGEQEFYMPYMSWNENTLIQEEKSEYTHSFYVIKNSERMDVVNAFFAGPIHVGMTKEEIKEILGYDESNSREKITSNGIAYGRELVLSDGTIIEDTLSGDMHVYYSNGSFLISLRNNIVEQLFFEFDAK